jgi:hypothetical protein
MMPGALKALHGAGTKATTVEEGAKAAAEQAEQDRAKQ